MSTCDSGSDRSQLVDTPESPYPEGLVGVIRNGLGGFVLAPQSTPGTQRALKNRKRTASLAFPTSLMKANGYRPTAIGL